MNQTIDVTRAAVKKPKPLDGELGFGIYFTDHMAVMEYAEGRGWGAFHIEPYGPLTLDPGAAVLHYAQAVFDGFKAFLGQDGVVRVFRPQKHIERLQRSAARLCIPAFDSQQALDAMLALVELEKEWTPRTPGTSLYIRPVIIATEPFLGVRPARSYLF